MTEANSLENIQQMRKFQQELERQMLAFDRVIPIAKNPMDVYSPRLYNILQAASAQVIAMMQILCNECQLYNGRLEGNGQFPNNNDYSRRQNKFNHYFALLNKYNALGIQKLTLIESFEIIRPFELNGQNTPMWWQAYNDTKHDLPEGAYLGTLGNTLNALSGLAVLHDLVNLAVINNWDRRTGLMKENWKDMEVEIFRDVKALPQSNGGKPWTIAVAERRNYPHRSRLFYHLMEHVNCVKSNF